MQINIQETKWEYVDTSTYNWKNYWSKIIWEVNATCIKVWRFLKKENHDEKLSREVYKFLKKRGFI